MKKIFLTTALALGAMTVSAQALEQPGFFDNWSVGIDGGLTTPVNNGPMIKNARGLFGAHIDKKVTPAFGIGVEGQFGVNTSSWRGHVHSTTAIDNSYVGVYGDIDLFNLFGGYQCGTVRPVTIDLVAGCGWGHEYLNENYQYGQNLDWNYFATKVGLNFNFNINPNVTISIKPSVLWNMNNGPSRWNAGQWDQTATAYSANNAVFNLQAGVTYHFGEGFQCVKPFNQAEIDALNGTINDLRGQLDAAAASASAEKAKADKLAVELRAAKNQKPETQTKTVEVVKEVVSTRAAERYVFFGLGKSNIAADQQPNVEMVAAYLKSHPKATVVVKGYASPDGNAELNARLAAARAESVKSMLVNRYKIDSKRVKAEGEGIGNMFEEESWNRVAICTIENAK